MAQNINILYTAEYIKDVLYFAVTKQGRVLQNNSTTHYFSIDSELVYENYYSDFGPLNLGCVYRYCNLLNEKLKTLLNRQIIVHYTSIDPKKKANAAFLLGCFGVLYLSLPPRDALRPLTIHGLTFRPFQDATQGDSIYTISLLDCLQAIKKARELGFFNFQDFDYEEYNRLDKIQGGDLNWILPGKFLAFIGPVDHNVSFFHPPEMYIDYFLDNNVKMVIRLNKRLYDGNVFRNVGIAHLDLFFPDGSCPPKHILFKFLQLSEDINGAIAIHCKAGLGRTGTLIGCYLIKHYRMTALEAIGWLRICRPGSVIGHQQGWLQQLEPWLLKQGNIYRKRMNQDQDSITIHRFGIYSIAEKTMQQRPIVVRSRMQSPLSPHSVQKRGSTEIKTVVRPQASKIREPNSQTSQKKLSSSKDSNTSQTKSKGDTPNFTRSNSNSGHVRRASGSFGAGEPRAPRKPSSTRSGSTRTSTTNNSATNTSKSNDSSSKNFNGFLPMPPFHLSHSPIIRNMNDARNFLMISNVYDDEKRKLLNPSITVKEAVQCPQRTSSFGQSTSTDGPQVSQKHSTPSTGSSKLDTFASRNPTRRRLGRSPSPSPTRVGVPSPIGRGTNTPPPPPPTVKSPRSTKNTMKEHISGLLSKPRPRDPSVFGAASLGARRVAPAPRLSPSVRSDERPLATQGDLLNSIKLQRRLRETLKTEGIKSVYRDINTPSVPKEQSGYRNNVYVRPTIQPKRSNDSSNQRSPQHRHSNSSNNKTTIPRSMSPNRRLPFY